MADNSLTIPLFNEPISEPSIRIARDPGQFIGNPITKLDMALARLKEAYRLAYSVAVDDQSSQVETRFYLLNLLQMVGNYLACDSARKRGE